MQCRKKKENSIKTAFVFIAPAFIFFTLFIIVPTVSSVYYSFTSWDGVSPNVKFIGLANYKRDLYQCTFWKCIEEEHNITDGIYLCIRKCIRVGTCIDR